MSFLRWMESGSQALDSYVLRVFVRGGGEGWDFVQLLFGSCSRGIQTGMPCVVTFDLDVHQWLVLQLQFWLFVLDLSYLRNQATPARSREVAPFKIDEMFPINAVAATQIKARIRN